MKILTEVKLETWSPNFSSSGQANPTWTRVRVEDTVIINSLGWVDWQNNPVQLFLCDACGTIQCNPGGYAHASRLNDFLLLTSPQIDPNDEWAVTEFAPVIALEKLGAVAIPLTLWTSWEMCALSSFPEANPRALAEAWALGPGRPKRIEEMPKMLRHRLVACDSLTPEKAIERVEHWLDKFLNSSQLTGVSLVRASELNAKVETLYFDGPANEDWPAFAYQGETEYLALNRDYCLLVS